MPKTKAAPLDSSIVLPKKGEARAAAPKEPAGDLISLTVRVDPERYRRLKMYGLDHRQSTQEIIIKAVDAFLEANK
jgi:hypothetical protein